MFRVSFLSLALMLLRFARVWLTAVCRFASFSLQSMEQNLATSTGDCCLQHHDQMRKTGMPVQSGYADLQRKLNLCTFNSHQCIKLHSAGQNACEI